MIKHRELNPVAGALKPASERAINPSSTFPDEAWHRTHASSDKPYRKQRLQRWTAALHPVARVAAAVEQRRQLRRRETPEALARQMLRKINALRAGYNAYRAHFKGAGATMLKHLNDAAGVSSAGLPAGERERLAALKKDYVAWLAYAGTGELPEQVFSAGMDLPVVEPGSHEWLRYLTPEQRQQFAASLGAHREYHRLSQRGGLKSAAWLAKDDGRGVRRALYDIMHESYNVLESLRRAGERAMRAASASERRAAREKAPKARAKPQTLLAPTKRGGGKEWLQYLDADQRRRVSTLLPSYNAYKRLQVQTAERDAWLQADSDGTHRALYDLLHEDYKEYQRLYFMAHRKREAERSAEEMATHQQAPSDEGEKWCELWGRALGCINMSVHMLKLFTFLGDPATSDKASPDHQDVPAAEKEESSGNGHFTWELPSAAEFREALAAGMTRPQLQAWMTRHSLDTTIERRSFFSRFASPRFLAGARRLH